MVKETIKNSKGVLYFLFDEIPRTQKNAQLVAEELRKNKYNAMLYPKVAWYKEILYYVYYKNKNKIVPNKEYVNNNGRVYDLYDTIERNKEEAIEKLLELRTKGFYALKRPVSFRNITESTIFFVYVFKKGMFDHNKNVKDCLIAEEFFKNYKKLKLTEKVGE